MVLRSLASLLIALIVLARAGVGHADEPATPLETRLSLSQVLTRAQRRSPSLGPAVATLAATSAVRREASAVVLAPPRVEVSAGPRFLYAGNVGPDVSLGVWLDLPTGGIASARERVATAVTRAARAGLRSAKETAALEAGLAWVDLDRAQLVYESRKKQLDEAAHVLVLAENRVEAGDVSQADALVAESVVGMAEASLLDAEGGIHEAQLLLGHLLGYAEANSLSATGSLVDDPAVTTVATAVKASRRHPTIVALSATALVASAAAELTVASGMPWVSFGPSVTREAGGDWLVLASVSIPLPVVNNSDFAAAQQRGTAAAEQAEVDLARRRLSVQARIAHHDVEHAIAKRKLVAARVLRPAKRAVGHAERRYTAGKTSMVELVETRARLWTAREHWIEAAAAARAASLRLDYVTGNLGAK